jgi:hypothetical protein
VATRNVPLPNGDIVSGVPDNISDEAVIAKYGKPAEKKPKEKEPADPLNFLLDEREAIRRRIDDGDTTVGQADLDIVERKLREAQGLPPINTPKLTPQAVEEGAPPSTGPSSEAMQDEAAKRAALLQQLEAQQSAAQPGIDRALGQALGAVGGAGVGGAMQTSQLARAGINALRQPPAAPRVEPTLDGPLTSGQKWLKNYAGHTDVNPSVTSVPEAAALHNRQKVGHGKISSRISEMYPQRPGQPNSIFERMGPTPEPPASPPMATPRTRAALDAVTNTFRTATQPFAAASRIGTQVAPTFGVPMAGIGVGGGLAEAATGVRQGDNERTALGGLEAAGSLASLIPKLARLGIPLTMAIEAYRALKDPADRARLHEMMFGRTEPDKPI